MKTKCPKCDHSFKTEKVKKKRWYKRFFDKVLGLVLILVISWVIITGLMGMLPDDSGESMGFWSAIKTQIAYCKKENNHVEN